MDDHSYRVKAPTILDLLCRITEAVQMVGGDATWVAHEDGEIHIYIQGEKWLLTIEQGDVCI